MDIELINQIDNHVKYGIVYSLQDVQDCIEKEAIEVQSEVKVDGFRPGKVPVDYIIRMYGEKLRINAMNKKVTDDISQIIVDKNYTLAAQPIYDFKSRQTEGDTNFYVELDLFVMPTMPELNYDALKISEYQLNQEAYQEALDRNLAMFQIMTADFNELTESASEDNDRILFTLKVTVNEEVVDSLGGKMQGIIGQEQLPPELEGQLKGRITGEEVVYTHEYPQDAENLFVPFLAGTKTTFDIKIEKIERPTIEELSEEKIKKIGFTSYDHLFEVLDTNTKSSFDKLSYIKMRNELFEHLQNALKDVAIPEFLLKQEAHNIALNEVSNNYGVDAMKEFTSGALKLDVTDVHKGQALKNIRFGLFVRNYVKLHNIELTETEVKKKVEDYLPELQKLNAQNPNQKNENYQGIITKARTFLLESKVVQAVLEKSSKEVIEVSQKDFFEKTKIQPNVLSIDNKEAETNTANKSEEQA